ncbi:MAG: hypothetical protein ACF8R7_14010 [Phycisphaerales bacterium JB039]
MHCKKTLSLLACAGLGAPALAQDVRMTHNEIDDLVEPGITIACSTTAAPQTTTDNSWWRAFSLSDFGIAEAITVSSIEFGIETARATALGGAQDVLIELFQAPAGSAPALGLELRGSATISVEDQVQTIFDAPVEGVIDAGMSLVVAITPPDHTAGGTATGDVFFIGSNGFGETDPSYIMAPGCGTPTPVTYDAIGFPGISVVMIVHGQLGAVGGCYPDCDDSGSLDFFDFLCFQNAFSAGEPYADCDDSGSLDFFDFLCFQNEFSAGCP